MDVISPQPAPVLNPHRLRKERNLFAVCAVVSLLISIGGSLPHFLKKHNELKRLNDEVVTLQSTIATANNQIRDAQAAIVKTQAELTEALKP